RLTGGSRALRSGDAWRHKSSASARAVALIACRRPARAPANAAIGSSAGSWRGRAMQSSFKDEPTLPDQAPHVAENRVACVGLRPLRRIPRGEREQRVHETMTCGRRWDRLRGAVRPGPRAAIALLLLVALPLAGIAHASRLCGLDSHLAASTSRAASSAC